MIDRRQQFYDWMEGELAPDGVLDFQEWICSSDSNALEFLKWASLEAQIGDAFRIERYQEVMRDSGELGEVVRGALRVRLGTSEQQQSVSALRNPRYSQNYLRLAFAAAMSAAALAAALLFVFRTSPSSPTSRPEQLAMSDMVEESQNVAEAATPFAVATLTALIDPAWKELESTYRQGEGLVPGDAIALSSGVAKLAFESGAEVILQGPCKLVVEDPMQAQLLSGNLAARVPRRASGFVVRSDFAEVVDLGTEFGFSVSATGTAEVHVFDGEVLSRKVPAEGEAASEMIRLNQHEALRFEAASPQPIRITADEQRFVRNASRILTAEQEAMLPVKDRLALWLAGDLVVERDVENRVVAWRDAVCGDNMGAEDALQVEPDSRPHYVLDAINGLPAIRFDGKQTYLVTTPLATTDDQTVFLVCQFHRSAVTRTHRAGGQILNYNGPPHRVLSTTFEPGVLQIGEPIIHDFAPTRLRAKVYAGESGGMGVSEGRIVTGAIGASRPVIVSYLYNNSENHSRLAIDGRVHGTSGARSPAVIVSRKVLGRHGFDDLFFDGDIAEVIIFNKALAPAELSTVTNYLGSKYAITIHDGL